MKTALLTLTLLVPFFCFSQIDSSKTGSCGTAPLDESELKAHYFAFKQYEQAIAKGRAAKTKNVNIAVKIHNVLTSGGSGNISNYLNLIFSNLNSKFSGLTISFYQLGSVNYIYSDKFYNLTLSEEAELTELNNVSNAINLYFVGNADDANGYAYLPLLDAQKNSNKYNCIFISTNKSSFSPNIVNETIPHEFGHYFNLLHTHEDGQKDNFNSNTREWVTRGQGANCSYAGDQICDTPADPYLFINQSGWEIDQIFCTSFFFNQKDPYGWTYNPDVSNLMSYYKGCRNRFTSGQFDRMIWGYNLRTQISSDLYNRYYIDGLLRFTYQSNNLTFCVGSDIDLSFWQFGEFDSGNNFKIQLSNDNGNSYFDVSTIRKNKNGLRGSLPANLTSGNYKVRVVSTSPSLVAGSIDITILGLPTATIAGNTEIFQTQPADLRVQLTGIGPWSFRLSDGTQVNTTYSNPHVVRVQPNITTTYTITSVSNQCGNGNASGNATVTVKPLTIATGNVSKSEYCVDSELLVPFAVNFPFPSNSIYTVQLSDANGTNFTNLQTQGNSSPLKAALPSNLSTGTAYKVRVVTVNPQVTGESSGAFIINAKPVVNITKQEKPENFVLKSNSATGNQWSFEGNAISNATDSVYIPEKVGFYSLQVSKGGCVVSAPDRVEIKIDKPSIQLIGENPFCENATVKLVAPESFGTYNWYLGRDVLSQNTREITVQKGGNYALLVGRGKIVSASSDTLRLQTKPIPPKPTISLESNVLKSSSASNNQWYLNGVAIKDSVNQTLSSLGSGSYTVSTTEKGCFSESGVFVITSVEIGKDELSVLLYPNPNSGRFWIELPHYYSSWTADILDMFGRKILTRFHSDKQTNRELIEMEIATGSYILIITTDRHIQSLRFVIGQ